MQDKLTDGEILLRMLIAGAFVWLAIWQILTFRRIGLNSDRTVKLLESIRDAADRQEERETAPPPPRGPQRAPRTDREADLVARGMPLSD